MMSRVTGFEAALDPEQSVGSAGTTGCMRVGGMSGRVVPALEPGADGYTWWHNDMAQPDDWGECSADRPCFICWVNVCLLPKSDACVPHGEAVLLALGCADGRRRHVRKSTPPELAADMTCDTIV